MTFKPKVWFPIALILSAFNLVGVGFAVALREGPHAGVHVALALAFGLWAQRLRRVTPASSALEERLEALEDEVSRLDALQADVTGLRQALSEAHERLDFAERLLAKAPDPRRP